MTLTNKGRLKIAIVGSGLSGSVLCDRLAGGHDVTLFERGSDQASRPPRVKITGRPVGLYPSFGYGLGGTTNYWHGGLVAMDPDEMGPAWPKDLKEDLPRFYEDAVRQLAGADACKAWLDAGDGRLDDDMVLTQLLHGEKVFRAREEGYTDQADLRLEHTVERIEESGSGVRVISRHNSDVSEEQFDLVILASGPNSSVILRDSGLGGSMCGDNYTDHPMGFVGKLRVKTPSAEFGQLRNSEGLFGPSMAMLKVRDTWTGLWSAFYLRAAGGPSLKSDPYARAFKFLEHTSRLKKYLAAVPHLGDRDFLWQAIENRAGKAVLPSSYAYVLVVNEQEATGQGSVSRSSGERLGVDWRISDQVCEAIVRNLSKLAAYTNTELSMVEGDVRERLWSAAHLSGTCRISMDQATGVVDQNLRVHGTKNVYVCDGSVLPSTGASNTGLTICSLAHRLSDELDTT